MGLNRIIRSPAVSDTYFWTDLDKRDAEGNYTACARCNDFDEMYQAVFVYGFRLPKSGSRQKAKSGPVDLRCLKCKDECPSDPLPPAPRI